MSSNKIAFERVCGETWEPTSPNSSWLVLSADNDRVAIAEFFDDDNTRARLASCAPEMWRLLDKFSKGHPIVYELNEVMKKARGE